MDFTVKAYRELLLTLIAKEYTFQTFREFIENPKERVVILRHDVDLLPQNALRFAKIQSELDIYGSYYFRIVPESYDESIIRQIAAMGHEIGYHYETMDTAACHHCETRSSFAGRSNLLNIGLIRDCFANSARNDISAADNDQIRIELAFQQFCENLEKLRKIADVNTICMHGSPRSKFDNREIWKHFSYKELAIIGEPYFDIDFNKVFYLTDTGRRWDGFKVSVRDKMPQQEKWNSQGLRFSATNDIVRAINHEKLPQQVMFTFHPQRWSDSLLPWAKELVWQNFKNIVKRVIVKT